VDIKNLHAIVWNLRRELWDTWLTPSPLDALRFAATEAAEAIDAQMRKDPRWARNHVKDLTVEQELAQCAIMLLTALGPEYDEKDIARLRIFSDTSSTLEYVFCLIGDALYMWSPGGDGWRVLALLALRNISLMIDLDTLLPQEADRFRQKWGRG